MNGVVLVVNSGSSSFKYQLLDMAEEVVLASGLVERIGAVAGRSIHTVTAAGMGAVGADAPTVLEATFERELPINDHTAGFRVMLEAFAEHPRIGEVRCGDSTSVNRVGVSLCLIDRVGDRLGTDLT